MLKVALAAYMFPYPFQSAGNALYSLGSGYLKDRRLRHQPSLVLHAAEGRRCALSQRLGVSGWWVIVEGPSVMLPLTCGRSSNSIADVFLVLREDAAVLVSFLILMATPSTIFCGCSCFGSFKTLFCNPPWGFERKDKNLTNKKKSLTEDGGTGNQLWVVESFLISFASFVLCSCYFQPGLTPPPSPKIKINK